MSARQPLLVPLMIDAASVERTWTTDPPIYTPHFAWDTVVTISAEPAIRVVEIESGDASVTVTKRREAEH